jgi:hypothetical protein
VPPLLAAVEKDAHTFPVMLFRIKTADNVDAIVDKPPIPKPVVGAVPPTADAPDEAANTV